MIVKNRYIQLQVSAQERQNAIVIDALEEELRVANEDKDHEIRIKNDVIRKLQVTMKVTITSENVRKMNTDMYFEIESKL